MLNRITSHSKFQYMLIFFFNLELYTYNQTQHLVLGFFCLFGWFVSAETWLSKYSVSVTNLISGKGTGISAEVTRYQTSLLHRTGTRGHSQPQPSSKSKTTSNQRGASGSPRSVQNPGMTLTISVLLKFTPKLNPSAWGDTSHKTAHDSFLLKT